MPHDADEFAVTFTDGAVTVGPHTYRLSGIDGWRLMTARDLLTFLEQQVRPFGSRRVERANARVPVQPPFSDKRLTAYTSARDALEDLEVRRRGPLQV